jgi:threonine/homoserine/homoserine lactone efflux protein
MSTTDQRQPATERQQRFLRAVLFVLVDVTVLALFVEYSDRIVIDSYTIALLTAILLQVLLKVTLGIEHRIAAYFRDRPGRGAIALRLLATWIVLFGSKFVILEAVDLVFGDDVELGGLIPFITLVVVMLAAEAVIERVYDALA